MSHYTVSKNGYTGYKYSLARPKSEKKTSIILRSSFHQKPFTYGTGLSIYPELWDQSTYRPTTDKKRIRKLSKREPHLTTELQNIRIRIENIDREIKTYLLHIDTNRIEFNVTDLKEWLNKTIKKTAKAPQGQKDELLLPYLDQTAKRMKSGKLKIISGRKRGQRYGKATIINYQVLHTKWSQFENYIGKKIRFHQVDMNLFDQLIDFFHSQSLSRNTISKYIRCLKVVLQLSYDEGLHSNQTYQNKKFSVPEIPSVSVYLNPKEIKAIKSQKLEDKTDQIIRDIFLIGCYTGLRYSDYSRIKPEHIKERDIEGSKRKVIDLITQKTSERVIIPISTELDQILKRYDYQTPKSYGQLVNDRIKDIAKEAKLTEPIEIEQIIGGMRVKTIIPKHRLIKTHTARRSAITNMYLSGIERQHIMKISGHRTEKSLNTYLKISKEDTINKIADMEFFKGFRTEMATIK